MIMWLPGIVWFIMVIAMVILYTDTHHRKPKPPPLDYFRIQQLEQLIYGETFPCEGAAYVPGKGAPVAPRPVAVQATSVYLGSGGFMLPRKSLCYGCDTYDLTKHQPLCSASCYQCGSVNVTAHNSGCPADERVKVTDVEVSYRLPIYPRIRYESNVAKLNSVKDGPDVVHNPWQPDRTIDGDVIR